MHRWVSLHTSKSSEYRPFCRRRITSIQAPAPENNIEFGEAIWVKVFTTELEDPVGLEELVGGNPKVEQAVTEKLEDATRIGKTKKDIARIFTVMNERGEKDIEQKQYHIESVGTAKAGG